MKHAIAIFLLVSSAVLAEDEVLDPIITIAADGSITLTDKSSYFTFSKDGSFRSAPLNLSGRSFAGRWELTSNFAFAVITVRARIGWMNGASPTNEYRRLVFWVYPGRKQPFKNPYAITQPKEEFLAYFLIDECVKIPKSEVEQ